MLNKYTFQKLFHIITWAFLLFFLYKTITYHITLISLNSPQEYREDASVVLTCRILDGKSIFTAADMPMYYNNYGFLYSYVAAPLAKIFGCDYSLHRAVTAFFALSSLLLLFLIALKQSKNFLTATLGIAILYHNFVHNPYEAGPKPDSLGMFLFLLSVLLPWIFRFSKVSLGASILLGILGFYAKPYFVASVLYVGAYLIITKRWKKALGYIALFLTVFLSSIFAVNYIYDFYFFNTVISLGKLTKYLLWYQAQMSLLYAKNTFGFLIFAGIVGFIARNVDLYIIFSLCLSIVIVVGKLGGNAGGYVQYYNELISPFLYLTVMRLQTKKTSFFLVLFLITNIIYLFTTTSYTINTKEIIGNWKQWISRLDTYHDFFTAPPFSLYAYKRGLPVYDTGHAEYFSMGTPGTHPEIPLFALAIRRYDEEFRLVERKIYDQEFEALVYWMPYTSIVEDLLYKGFLREYVKTHYKYDSCQPWVTVYGTSCFDVWERP